MVQKSYKRVHYYMQIRIITNMVQRKLPRFTYNSVRSGNNVVTVMLFKFLAMVFQSDCKQLHSSEAETSTLYSLCYVTIAWTKPYSCAFTALGILDNLFLMSAFSLNLGNGCTINLLCLLLVPSLSPKFWSLEFWSPRPKFSLENMVRPLQNRYAGKFVSVKHSYQSICVRRLFIPCTDKLTMVQVDQFSRIWSLGPKFSLDQNFHHKSPKSY